MERHCGVTFGFYRRAAEWDKARLAIEFDHMAELNVKWVCVVPTVMKETSDSPRQFHDYEVTPSDIDLADAIDAIHERGMKVQLRPMIENYDGWGRLRINFPPDGDHRIPGLKSVKWEGWWRAMNARTRHYARIAERTGCEMYGLDSEIDLFVHMNDEWRTVLATARGVFSGPITSCHTHTVDFLKELADDNCWFRDLDVLGTSFYFASEAAPGASVTDRIEFLKPRLEQYREMAAAYGKPIMFGECGCTSCSGAGMRPASWHGGDTFDPDEQANHLEAVLRTFWDEPWWAGLYWWKWDENNDRPQFRDDPKGDKGFTVYGKRAGDVMSLWYDKA